MPLASNTFYLCNAVYSAKKKRVKIEFSNLNEKISISFPFTPCILIHRNSLDASMEKLLFSGSQKIEEASNGIKVFSHDFAFLEYLNSIIDNKGILLPAETQFLLSKNWSFFDSFEVGNEIKKIGFNGIPEIKLNSDSLSSILSEMLSYSAKDSKNLMHKIILSNILALNPTKIPSSKPKILDSFIESILFKNGFAFEKKKPKFDSGFSKKSRLNEFKEVSFSSVWPTLLSFPFYNVGFDSVNCSCCKPEDLSAGNVLPSSLVEVEFLEDGIYFDSVNEKWSSFFHFNAEGKEKRLKRKSEWHLRKLPSGPFFRKDVLRIPLFDALNLNKERKVVFLDDHYLEWSCRKKENFISKELNKLSKQILFFEKKINEAELNSIKEHGIAFSLFLQENAEFNFFSEFLVTLKTLFYSLPFHLSSFSSSFFDSVFSNTIQCIFSCFLEKFRQFSFSNSVNSLVGKESVLIDSDNALHLVTEFSRSEGIPLPEIFI
jgi:hypothetical protein